MAIDRTGISSLDSGALDIKYTGDEGPKSPNQIAGGEYNRVLELLEKVRENIPLSEEEKMELQGLIKTLTAKGINVESLMREATRMASADPMLQDEYDKYVFELQEMHPEARPMSIEEFKQQAISGMAEGGIARLGYRGGQLVQPGPGRPGYQGPLYAAGPSKGPAGGQTMSGGGGYSDAERHQAQQQEQAARVAMSAPRGIETISPETRVVTDASGNVVPGYTGPEPKDKNILEKTKDVFLGPSKWLVDQFSKKHTPYYIQHALENYRKKMGYDSPALYDEEEGDDFIKQALIDIDLAKEGNLSTKEFEKYMPDWQLAQRYPNDPKYAKYRTIGGEGGPNYYAPRDMHPGTGGITDATDETGTTSDWDVASLDLPFDRSTSEHDFSSQYFYGADGGRARYAGGGDVRQNYGLGKFVKKIGKTFKKAAKSPLGKAALAFAAYKFGPQLLSGKGFSLGDTKKWGDLIWSGADKNVNLARLKGIPS